MRTKTYQLTDRFFSVPFLFTVVNKKGTRVLVHQKSASSRTRRLFKEDVFQGETLKKPKTGFQGFALESSGKCFGFREGLRIVLL